MSSHSKYFKNKSRVKETDDIKENTLHMKVKKGLPMRKTLKLISKRRKQTKSIYGEENSRCRKRQCKGE